MKYRELGATKLQVSEIGFGGWGIGGQSPYGETDDKTSEAAIERAIELGINYFDTSPAYGRSVDVLGRTLRRLNSKSVVATKVGWDDFSKAPDYTPGAIRSSIDQSLRRLGAWYVAVAQLHNPPLDIGDDVIDCLKDLKRKRKILAYGISAKTPGDAKALMERHKWPIVQVNFNIADTRAKDCGVLALAKKQKVGVVARSPLCSGFSRWKGDARTALRFCISHEEIATAIPGIMTPQQAEENAAASY